MRKPHEEATGKINTRKIAETATKSYQKWKEPTASSDVRAPKLFHGDSSSVSWVRTNGSIIFSVPLKQIKPGLLIYVPFHYLWELNEQLIFNNEPAHRVFLRGVDLANHP